MISFVSFLKGSYILEIGTDDISTDEMINLGSASKSWGGMHWVRRDETTLVMSTKKFIVILLYVFENFQNKRVSGSTHQSLCESLFLPGLLMKTEDDNTCMSYHPHEE